MKSARSRARRAIWVGAAVAAVLFVTVMGVPPVRAAPGTQSGALEDLLVPDRYFIVTADELVGRGARVTPVTGDGAGPFEVMIHFESAEIRRMALTQNLSNGKPLYLQITSEGVARVTGVSMRTDLLSLIGTVPGTAEGTDPVQFLLDLLESGGQVTLRVKDVGMRATWMHTGTASLPGAVLRFVHDASDLAQRDRIERVERQSALMHRLYKDLDDFRRRNDQSGSGESGGSGTTPGLPHAPGIPGAPEPGLPGLPQPPGGPGLPDPPVPPELPSSLRDLLQCLERELAGDPWRLLDRDTLLSGDPGWIARELEAVDPAAVLECGLERPGDSPGDARDGPHQGGGSEGNSGPGGPQAGGGPGDGESPIPTVPPAPEIPRLDEALACVAETLDLDPASLVPLNGEEHLTLDRLVAWLLRAGLVRGLPLDVLLRLEAACGEHFK